MLFFSVIIPLYNKADRVGSTLQSVLNQNFTDFEICLIDDGSTDNSLEIVNAFRDNRLKIFKQTHQGVSSARNRGIKEAKGRFLAFLDADDEWYSDYLTTLHQMILEHPGVKVFGVAMDMYYRGRRMALNYALRGKKAQEVSFFESSRYRTFLSCSSVAISPEVFIQLGEFDKRLSQGEDTDFWFRLGLQFRLVFHPVSKACYYYSDSNFIPGKLPEPWVDFLEKFRKTDLCEEAEFFVNANYTSMYLRAKINRQKELYKNIKPKILKNYLSFKYRILIQLPAFWLRILIKLKNYAASKGFSKSVFK